MMKLLDTIYEDMMLALKFLRGNTITMWTPLFFLFLNIKRPLNNDF